MMKNQPVVRDERYFAVENASYRIGYMIIIYGLLLLIVARSILFHESNWDLFALVLISSFAATIYQAVHKIIPFSWKWINFFIAITLLGAVVGFILTSLTK